MGLWLRSLTAATIVAALLLGPTTAGAQVPAGFTDTLVASVPAPTDHAFTPDGRLLITTQPGALRVYSGGLLPTPALTFAPSAICTESERGLLGVAVDPAFSTNGYVYLYYTANIAGVGCKKPRVPVHAAHQQRDQPRQRADPHRPDPLHRRQPQRGATWISAATATSTRAWGTADAIISATPAARAPTTRRAIATS